MATRVQPQLLPELKKDSITMNARENQVSRFQKAMEQPIDTELSSKQLILRMSFIDEEVKELRDEVLTAVKELEETKAVSHQVHVNLLKELGDVMYVASGFAVTFGLPISRAFDRIHESNMSKMVDGKAIKNDEGKVMKGPNYRPPILGDLVSDQLELF
jgi:predicted HAD superfamily Cof-like phosphohydrolase